MATISLPKSNEYIPGMCNIGPAERAERRRMGFIGVIATLFLLVLLLSINAPWGFRLFLIIPASLAATGFLQDALHFCAGFGMRGFYNVLNSAGETTDVGLEEYRIKDKRKAQQIVLLSLAIGIIVAVLTVFI